jgi:phosphoglycolate phosphatase
VRAGAEVGHHGPVRWSTVLFDLDGTLTDPLEGIGNSIQHGLAAIGVPPLADDQLRSWVGPPLQDSFAALGLDQTACDGALRGYRDYFARTGLYENRVYDGIDQVLVSLAADGVGLAVATSKPTVFAQQILDHFGLASHFTFVSGAGLDGSHRQKHEVITNALAALDRQAAAGGIVMVGDREHDVLGAAQLGLPCIGVAWGYAAPGELERAGATRVVATPEELLDVLGEL